MGIPRVLILSFGAGLAAAALGSLALAGHPQDEALSTLGKRIDALPRRQGPAGAPPPVVLAAAPPLFPVFTGPAASPEAMIRLDGIARSPMRIAALISINAAPAVWLSLGEEREGVTLAEVSGASITVETLRGPRVVTLSDGPPPASPTVSPAATPPPGAPQAAPAATIVSDAPPPGFRSPMEPASAPGTAP